MTCKHMNFDAEVRVARIEDKGRFMAEIRIKCLDCGIPMQFLGLKPGLDFDGATVSLDGLEANIERLQKLQADPVNARLLKLLRESRRTLEMWKDVAPAVSLCADIDSAIAAAEALKTPVADSMDTVRIDWLADRDNTFGQVLLPSECVTANLGSLRAAIDMAMQIQTQAKGD